MLEMKGNQMFRTISFTVVCLILSSTNSAVAQKKPFKNKTARAAQKTYEEAIAKAKKEYVAKLEIAVKEAGGAGDLEEANRLAAEKKNVETGENDPLTSFRRRMIGTKWYGRTSRNVWNRFDKNNFGVSESGYRFFWVVTVKNTVVIQYVNNLKVYVWHFDDKGRAATVFAFKKTGKKGQWRR